MSVARHVIKDPFTRARIPGWISPWVHPGFRGEKTPKILGTSSGAKFEKQSNTTKHKNFNFRAYHNIQQAMQDDAIRTARIHPAFFPVTGLKCSCGKISSLRSKRFRLVSEQNKIRGTVFSVLTAREMKREPFFPTPSPLFYLRHFSRGLWLLFLVLCS